MSLLMMAPFNTGGAALTITDTFNRADTSTLANPASDGHNWIISCSPAINVNRLSGQGGGGSPGNLRFNLGSTAQTVAVTGLVASGYPNVLLQCDSTGGGGWYMFFQTTGNALQDSATFTTQTPTTGSAGSIAAGTPTNYTVSISGSTITLKQSGSVIATWTVTPQAGTYAQVSVVGSGDFMDAVTMTTP